MFTSAGASSKKMSWRRAKTPGWAAFDLKQRRGDGFEPEGDSDTCPLISSSVTLQNTCQNLVRINNLPARSFSSVILPPATFPTLTGPQGHEKVVVSNSSAAQGNNSFTDKTDIAEAYGKLKELHGWADESLIEDIMAVVDNDVNKASALLREMVSSENFGHKHVNVGESKSDPQYLPSDYNKLLGCKGDSFGESTEDANLRCVLQDCLSYKNEGLSTNYDSGEKKNSDDAATVHMKLILGSSLSIPIEPEWEDDDIYLTHRRDAVKMMRSASRLSRLATDAYLRGDHFSAKQYSEKGREEWMAAERLNAKAAKEILNIRNSENDLWKLDLHGLHSVEAVQALQERLQELEFLVQSDLLVAPNRNSTGAGITGHDSHMGLEKLGKQSSSTRQRPTSLHVITGRGNHSRGQAALPTAVRSFLNENGYCYEESRPGVITVRPKFGNKQRT